jgi:hypothetical protein
MDQQAAAADGVAEAGDPGDHIDQLGHTEPLAFSRTTLDYAEILARLPKPPGRPRKALLLQRG